MSQIMASATVDPVEGLPETWDVEVWGGVYGEDAILRRKYRISAEKDDNAAQEGIRLFVDEMERLLL